MPIKFECRCSKEAFYKGILSLGKRTINQLLTQDLGAEATCHYCGKKYYFDENELKEMLTKAK